jgi:hypothetical protein
LIQADDNDSYLLSYRDLGTGDRVRPWQVPPDGDFGMQTRPHPRDAALHYTFAASVETDALRFEADSVGCAPADEGGAPR